MRSKLSRPPSGRDLSNEALKPLIMKIYKDNYSVYGYRKIRVELQREHGLYVDKDRVRKLMKELGIKGVTRKKKVFTTKADPDATRAPDLVRRNFYADKPNELWISDFTYVPTQSHMAYVAFVIDVYARMIVGWSIDTSMKTDLVMKALEQAIFKRNRSLEGVIAHNDAGSQYTSIRYTERLKEIGARPSIGTVGDSYDNAMAETTIGLYKAELVNTQGPWRDVEHLELATLLYVEWFNNKRLHGEIGHIPPVEAESNYYDNHRLLESTQ